MSVHVVSVITQPKYNFPNLKKSIIQNGHNIVELARGKKYIGHFMKDTEMIDYCKKIDKNDIVIFLDGYDSLLVGDIDEACEIFKSLDTPMLISCDYLNFCQALRNNPIFTYLYYRVFFNKDNLYLNSGMYMGYAGAILNFLNEVRKDKKRRNSMSNQKAWIDFCLENESNSKYYKIDTKCDIFFNYLDLHCDINNMEINDKNHLYYHFPWGRKRIHFMSFPASTTGINNINITLKRLNYDPINIKKKETFLLCCKRIKYYISYFYFDLLVLCIGGMFAFCLNRRFKYIPNLT
jgi:hypothetical protein